MPSLEPRKTSKGTSWRFVYQLDGRQKKITIGVTNQTTAQKRYIELANILASGRDPAAVVKRSKAKSIKLSETLTQDMKWCEGRRQPRTIESYTYAWNLMVDHIGDIQTVRLTKEDAEDWIKSLLARGWSPAGVGIVFRAVRAILSRAVKVHGILESNPFSGVQVPRIDSKRQQASTRPRYLTRAEVDALLELIPDGELLHLVRFMLLTGARPSEALEITWKKVDLDHKELWLGDPNSLTKLYRRFPIGDQLRELILQIPQGNPNDRLFAGMATDHRALDKRFKRLFESKRYTRTHPAPPEEERKRRQQLISTIGSTTPYVLRHTFASHALLNGVPIKVVASWLGHTTTYTTELYGHLITEISDEYTDRIKF